MSSSCIMSCSFKVEKMMGKKIYICHFLKVAPALVVDTHQAGVRVKNCLAEVDIIPTVVFCPVIPIMLAPYLPCVQRSSQHQHPVHLHTHHWKYCQ